MKCTWRSSSLRATEDHQCGFAFVNFPANDSTLVVGEEYSIKNASQPAQAYFRTETVILILRFQLALL
jgi:hypothetical protein